MQLQWDQAGTRFFETGIDRGVLYPPEGPAVSWNGLTQVTENRIRETKPYYIDGIKYLEHHVAGSYAAKLQALTYPYVLDNLLGIAEFAPGVFLHDQRARMFNLSYRTKLGNDLEGIDLGYRIHLLYNIIASPSDVAFASLGDAVTPAPFEWDLKGVPATMYGIRPTSHISFDSRLIAAGFLSDIEELIYGGPDADASLPDLVTLLQMIAAG